MKSRWLRVSVGLVGVVILMMVFPAGAFFLGLPDWTGVVSGWIACAVLGLFLGSSTKAA